MADAAVDELLRYERGWANAMGDYWRERMERLRTIDTGRLYASIKAHLEQGSVTTIEHNFLQYGIYVAAGVGPAHEWYKWTEAQGGEKVHRINNGDLNFLGEEYRRDNNLDKPKRWALPGAVVSPVANLKADVTGSLRSTTHLS